MLFLINVLINLNELGKLMIIRFSGKGLSCRQCSHETLLRVHRHVWMKFIPGSRLYRCDKCQEESLVLSGARHIELANKQLRSGS